jgi:hypothetical protein
MSFLISTRRSCGEGCQNGITMDDDVYAEGWEPDVVYPPCSCHPKHCKMCRGSGRCPEDVLHDSDDCPTCGGNGWLGAPEHPDRSPSQDSEAGNA